MKLVIAEKPSVAMAISSVIGARSRREGYMEGNDYIVSWCIGHLVGLCDAGEYDEKYKKWRYDDLPIVPEHWETKVLGSTRKQYQILEKLMLREDITEIICATDAGREGELIFRLVYEQAGCHKQIKRLWISSMEEKSIKDGFQNLKDGSYYDDLYQSALCRAQADWLVGINASRLFSVLYNKTLRIGRVQSPTLAMIVEQDQKVNTFVKEQFFETQLVFGNIKAVSERFQKREDAEQLADLCQNKSFQILSDEKKEKTVPPPKLYDLTTLQRDANRVLGYTAQETLDVAQYLYEEGIITYPRTDSQYLNDEMDITAASLIEDLEKQMDFVDLTGFEPDLSRILDSKKVSDHHAIIQTDKAAACVLKNLKTKERNILLLIETRVLMAAGKPYRYVSHRCDITCSNHHFSLCFTSVIQNGYKTIEKCMYQYLGKKLQEEEPASLNLEIGKDYSPCSAEVLEKWTQPPKEYTEDTLLSAMERAGNDNLTDDTEKKGLGTPATRAAIIEKLVRSGLIIRDKKSLVPTNDGNVLITILPEEIKSPKMTAEWEMKLNQIAKGEASPKEFMSGIIAMMTELTSRYEGVSESKSRQFSTNNSRERIGICPRCGNPIYEGTKNYFCSSKECQFALFKNDKFFESQGKKLDKGTVKKLLDKGRIHYKDLRSKKTGKTYEATIVLCDTGEGYAKYNLEFPQR